MEYTFFLMKPFSLIVDVTRVPTSLFYMALYLVHDGPVAQARRLPA